MKQKNLLIVYSTAWCPDCIRSKKWLDDHKIPYQEINIEEDEAAMEYVIKVNDGRRTIPTIVFPNGDILTEPTNKELEEKIAGSMAI